MLRVRPRLAGFIDPRLRNARNSFLFTAEDYFGLMVGRREIIMQPAPHLGPLEIIHSDFVEGLFVGLLPYQEPSRARQ